MSVDDILKITNGKLRSVKDTAHYYVTWKELHEFLTYHDIMYEGERPDKEYVENFIMEYIRAGYRYTVPLQHPQSTTEFLNLDFRCLRNERQKTG